MEKMKGRRLANQKIREALKDRKVRQWELAEKMGMAEFTLSRKLRHELSEEETAHALKLIDEIAKQYAD